MRVRFCQAFKSAPLVRADKLVAQAIQGEEVAEEVTIARKRREKASSKAVVAVAEAADVAEIAETKTSERRRRREERRGTRENKRQSVVEDEEERTVAVKQAHAAASEVSVSSDDDGPTLSGMFIMSGIDHDEITENVKKHMVGAMLTTLVGLEPAVAEENIRIKVRPSHRLCCAATRMGLKDGQLSTKSDNL